MPTINRDLQITFGTLVMGGDQDIYILGGWSHGFDYGAASVSFRVMLQSDTEVGLQSACDTFEAGIRQIDVAIEVTYGGATAHVDYDPTANTGMLTRATAEVVEGFVQTKLSRAFDVTLTAVLPADESGAGGIRRYDVEQRTGANGLSAYVVTGEYTATSAGTAAANFADGSTGGSAIAASISGAGFEEVSNVSRYDRRNKVLTFEIVHAQIGYRQSVGTTDIASIKNQRLEVSRRSTAPGDMADARRLVELAVGFTCDVDATVTTDLAGLWESTIRPNLIETVRTVAGAAVALIDDRPVFRHSTNSIAASMEFMAFGGSPILKHTITTTDDTDTGVRLVPLYDVDPLAKERFDGPARSLRMVVEDTMRFGGAVGAGATGSSGAGGFAGQNFFGVGVATPGGLTAGGTFGGQVGSFSGSIFGGAGIVGQGFQAGVEISRPSRSGSAADQGSGSTPISEDGYITLRVIDQSQPLRLGLPEAGFDIEIRSTTTIMEFAAASSSPSDGGADDTTAGQGQSGRGISTPRVPTGEA